MLAYMVLMTSGLTASISLLEVAKLKKGQTVLVRRVHSSYLPYSQ